MNPLVANDLSPYQLLVTLLALVVGVLTVAQSTGKLLGQWDLSPTMKVVVTMLLPFLAGAAASYGEAGVFTTLSTVNAIVSGFWKVLAAASPALVVHAAVHAHFVVPDLVAKLRKTPAKNDDAAAAGAAPPPAEPPKAT